MQDRHGVVGLDRLFEFDEAVAIVLIGELVLGHVDARDVPYLSKELGEEFFVAGGIKISHVDRGILIAVLDDREGGHDSEGEQQPTRRVGSWVDSTARERMSGGAAEIGGRSCATSPPIL